MRKSSVLKSILAAMLFIAAAVIIFLTAARLSENSSEKRFEMPSNAARVEFLNKYGLIVKPVPEVQDITIPRRFGTVYEEYNKLQLSQGFDLKEYAGRDAVLCSYTVLNCPEYPENVRANMVICDNILIACDVTLNEENGFTRALVTDVQEN